jgi:hypothetical protein
MAVAMSVSISIERPVCLCGRDTPSDRRGGSEIDVIRKRRALLREVNEQIRRTDRALPGDPTSYILLCECERAECLQRLEVPAELYAEVRSNSDRFLVIEGHEDGDGEIERVVAGDGYCVVRVRTVPASWSAPSPLSAA